MLTDYEAVIIPITIYVEELCDPIVVIDKQGNILPNEVILQDQGEVENEAFAFWNEYGLGNEVDEEDSRSKFDGSSDSDYICQESCGDGDTDEDDDAECDSPSLISEDLNACSDDDVFMTKILGEDTYDCLSDPGEEDELHSIGENMKKFKDDRVIREALTDYCVRHGYDLHLIRNENASPIMRE
ncbi:hypothetical protein Pfo_015623 [Paulownia fortunei]|nr:hypothetical protein Pfo_015623 [Paulownia fortunei]